MSYLYLRPWISELEAWRYDTDAHPPFFQRAYNRFREMGMGPQEAAHQLEQGLGLRLYWIVGQYELSAVYDKKTGLFHKFEYEKPASTDGNEPYVMTGDGPVRITDQWGSIRVGHIEPTEPIGDSSSGIEPCGYEEL